MKDTLNSEQIAAKGKEVSIGRRRKGVKRRNKNGPKGGFAQTRASTLAESHKVGYSTMTSE